jgi:methionyl-tRNA formyltransferase
MTILFAGTPAIAVPCLDALVGAGHRVEVLTNPDAPAGRGGKLTPSPVKEKALELGLAVHQPAKLDGSARDLFAGRFDLLVSFAYGRIFGPLFLGLFPAGGLNVHPSLLPRWRGPSPLTAALLARDAQTGISVQRLALKMDSGDVVVRSVRNLDGTETTGSLTEWAAQSAPALLVEAVLRLQSDTSSAEAQDEAAATYCSLVQKDDGRLDWSRSALEIDAKIRAYDPWPGAFTGWQGQRLALRNSSVISDPGSGSTPGTVVSVDKSDGILIQTGDGLVAVRELQLPARKSLDFRSFLNGNPALVGSRLGEHS